MARPRTPSNILDARGAFDKNPNRRRENEPEPLADIGEVPERLKTDEAEAWAEIVSSGHEGVFCQADRIAVEVASVLLAAFRADPIGMPAAKLARLDSLLARFGMTPSDRSKVSAPKKAASNPFEKLIGKGKQA